MWSAGSVWRWAMFFDKRYQIEIQEGKNFFWFQEIFKMEALTCPSEIFWLILDNQNARNIKEWRVDHYIHTSTHWKATIKSKWTFFCVCSYVCNDPELETAYKQAPKTGFIQNISPGKEKESFIMFRFWGKACSDRNLLSGHKLITSCPLVRSRWNV